MDWARLLGVQALGRRWCARSVLGARGVRGRACVGARARARAWALGAGRSARGAQATAARARGAQAGTRAGVGAAGRGRPRGAARQGAGARRQLGGRRARGRAAGVGARGAGLGRAAWAWPGRLGWPWAVHSVHSAHFRSVLTRFFFFLSHQMNTVHCKVKFFRKKKIIFIKFK